MPPYGTEFSDYTSSKRCVRELGLEFRAYAVFNSSQAQYVTSLQPITPSAMKPGSGNGLILLRVLRTFVVNHSGISVRFPHRSHGGLTRTKADPLPLSALAYTHTLAMVSSSGA